MLASTLLCVAASWRELYLQSSKTVVSSKPRLLFGGGSSHCSGTLWAICAFARSWSLHSGAVWFFAVLIVSLCVGRIVTFESIVGRLDPIPIIATPHGSLSQYWKCFTVLHNLKCGPICGPIYACIGASGGTVRISSLKSHP